MAEGSDSDRATRRHRAPVVEGESERTVVVSSAYELRPRFTGRTRAIRILDARPHHRLHEGRNERSGGDSVSKNRCQVPQSSLFDEVAESGQVITGKVVLKPLAEYCSIGTG